MQRSSTGRHRLVVKARRFGRLPRPMKTATYEKHGACQQAEEFAAGLRLLGARVLLIHVDHRPSDAPEFDPE